MLISTHAIAEETQGHISAGVVDVVAMNTDGTVTAAPEDRPLYCDYNGTTNTEICYY